MCQRSTKSINGSQCKHHGNYLQSLQAVDTQTIALFRWHTTASISRPGLGLCILFIWWNAKRNIFLVYRRIIFLNGNAAFKGQKVCILHIPLKYCFNGKKDLCLSSFNTHPRSHLRNANYFLWGYLVKGGCRGHILLTQDCVNAFVRIVELKVLRALREELKSQLSWSQWYCWFPNSFSKLDLHTIRTRQAFGKWHSLGKNPFVAHPVQIYLGCTQIQLYKHHRLCAYLA